MRFLKDQYKPLYENYRWDIIWTGLEPYKWWKFFDFHNNPQDFEITILGLEISYWKDGYCE